MRGGSPPGRTASLLSAARFELVPAKTVDEQIPFLPADATITVTSSPRRGPEPTLALVERLAARGFRAVPHLAARHVAGGNQLEEIVARLEGAGIREVFVVGGDGDPAGPFPSALALLRAMAEIGHGFDQIGVAGYPERHPLVEDRVLLRELKAKQEFATYLVTQICFDPRAVAAWASGLVEHGIELPMYVGMPGVARRAKLLEISLRIGVGDSVRYLRKHGGLVWRLVGRRAFRPDAFVASLADAPPNVVGFHINTFNQVESTERWRRAALANGGATGHPRAAESSGQVAAPRSHPSHVS